MKKTIILAIILGVFFIISCGSDDVTDYIDPITVVLYPDTTVTVFYADTLVLTHNVWSTNNTAVTWYVNDIENGNSTYGTIDSSETDSTWMYIAPESADDFDEVLIKVISQADTSKYDTLLAIIRNQYFVYVDSATGDDDTGKGTIAHPYLTITKGIQEANQGQIVYVANGTYGEGETFPMILIAEVTVQGYDIDSTIITAPSDTSTFRLSTPSSTVKHLTIRGVGQQGIGIEFGGTSDVDSLRVGDINIENCYTAFTKTGAVDTIAIEDVTVTDCINGIVINETGERCYINDMVFTNIDSTAFKLNSPVYSILNSISVDNAFIGVQSIENGFCAVYGSTFANIDSTAVLFFYSGDLQAGDSSYFSDCANWCVMNMSAYSIAAEGNAWPSTDSTTIDTYYIYDDDENPDYGVVDFTSDTTIVKTR